MLSVFCLFLLLGIGNGIFQTPNRPPSITVKYDDGNLVSGIDLEYIGKPSVKYTYDVRFNRWEGSSSLYSSEAYGSRTSSPSNWEQLWVKSPTLNPVAISGNYGAWPLPAPYWNLSITGKDTVRYTSKIPLVKLLEAGLVELEVTATHFVYRGILFTHYLQPVREFVYSATSYSKPFVISLDRKTEGMGGMEISPVEASILSSEASGLTGLSVSVETHAPPLGSMSYGRLHLVSVSGIDTLTSLSYEKDSPCSLEAGNRCRQIWALILDRTSGGYYNDTYTLNYGLRSCFVSSPDDCIDTDANVKIGLLISGGSATVSHISTLAVETHNITYYYDNLFSQQRLDSGYAVGETIRFRHLSRGDYALELWNLWMCATVESGLPPSLGVRRGCSEPESIDGTINIPEDMRWQLLAEGEYTDAAEKFGFKLEGKDAASIQAEPLVSLSSTIYLHLESRASRLNTAFRQLERKGKHEMGAAVIDGIHTLVADTSPVWMWPVIGTAFISMGIGALYAYCKGKKKSFLTGTVRV